MIKYLYCKLIPAVVLDCMQNSIYSILICRNSEKWHVSGWLLVRKAQLIRNYVCSVPFFILLAPSSESKSFGVSAWSVWWTSLIPLRSCKHITDLAGDHRETLNELLLRPWFSDKKTCNTLFLCEKRFKTCIWYEIETPRASDFSSMLCMCRRVHGVVEDETSIPCTQIFSIQ